MSLWLDKLGTSGAIVAAIGCPICFPKLAVVGALLGLGGLAAYEKYFILLVQILIIVALVGHIMAYRHHHNRFLLLSAVALSLAFFVALYLIGNEWLLYLIFAGHIFLSFWLMRENKKAPYCAS